MNVIYIDYPLVVLVHFISCSLLSQFPSPYPVVQIGGLRPTSSPPATLQGASSSSGPLKSSSHYSPPLVLPQQQGGPLTSQTNIGSYHTSLPLHLSQVQPAPYSAPYLEQELAQPPVQVNMWLRSHCNGLVHGKSVILRW